MRALLSLATASALALAATAPAAARPWFDPDSQPFQSLETWQLVVVALLTVALAGLLLFLLVRLIYRFFSWK